MRVTPTGAFLRSLERLSIANAEDTAAALELFVANPQAKSLNFERVRSRKGYFTIRSNYSIRILLRQTGTQEFEAVAVGNHDYIYESFFR
ncbi:MAG: hypothetical protein JWR80_4337 [Bradyrhizobium sp.]|nr:hypothetical protein [Bradyrhizobium sp.]